MAKESAMRVMIVSRNDIFGGAARAAYRLHRSLISEGIDSKMIVLNKQSVDESVFQVPLMIKGLTLLGLFIEKLLLRLQRSANPTLHSLNWFPTGVGLYINSFRPDIINLHWINDNFVSLLDITFLRAPIVWTQHDAWLVLGAEHCDSRSAPGRFRFGYDKLKRPADESGLDINYLAALAKRFIVQKVKFLIVSPSHWLANMISETPNWQSHPVKVIPNACPSSIYKNISKAEARERLNLPQDKHIILISATNLRSDVNKGLHHLQQSLDHLKAAKLNKDIVVITFGAPAILLNSKNITTINVDSTSDDAKLSLYYNAATVTVLPSEQENLSNTLIESIMCGTPCVAFDIGGNKEIIDDGVNGFLVPPFDVIQFKEAIVWVLQSDFDANHISRLAAGKFSPKGIAIRYIEAFRNILSN